MNELDMLYQQLILEHSKRPFGQVEIEAAAGELIASHHEMNPSCGDELTLTATLDPQSEKLTQIGWQGSGCSISMASVSILSQLFEEEGGFTLDQARERIGEFRHMIQSRGKSEPNEDLLGDAVALQGVSKFIMRIKCAMLGWVALEADIHKLEAEAASIDAK